MSIEDAVAEVLRFGQKSWASSNWELLIRGSSQFRGVLACIGLTCSQGRLQDVIDFVAAALRKRYPQFTNSARAWRDKKWDIEDALQIIEFVRATALDCLRCAQPTTASVADISSILLETARTLAPGAWSPWQPFVRRKHVPLSPGLYMFGRFQESPPVSIDPCEERIVYIGMAVQQSLDRRLAQFAEAWNGGTGHSGAFTLRNLLLQDAPQEVSGGHMLFVSWMWFRPADAPLIPALERKHRHAFRDRHGHFPFADRSG